ncbi:molybdopterin-synthase adenylyltransferase MoeB [Paracoccus sp. MBLB3053]|uniref:Molybdopterin-synthase adenylyltransferase MoeB n=1 Tax=Paracoccus aurantius TaxID=3073814 RepID=A0ABU2HQF3_9RHOB|nr:molybdopterin-synthase adenylyltransferase MoeB [Paracoccus sp. MBLB3053]MDS9467279.1 molybdopterin-synthase adenylyltransferase MoeB [Paracoccus sp. MBLB3053]
MIVLLLMAAVLVAGAVFGMPRHRIWAAIGGLWLAALAVLFISPGSWAARLAGDDLRYWLIGGAFAALVIGYRAILRQLHRKAIPLPEVSQDSTARSGPLSDAELDRYARHIVLRELGGPGQAALRRARVLIVGAGGLGAPTCLYLAAAGIGRITLADDDHVSLSNLQRQVIFRASDADRPKAEAAAEAMRALNPHVSVTPLNRRISEGDAALIAEHDLVIDGTDTFAARQAVNSACAAAGVPLVAGAIAQWEGQVTVWDPKRGAPCMACIFPEAPAAGLAPACAEAGVVGPLPGIIGSMMALEAIKILASAGEPLRSRMMIFDGLWGENRVMKLARRSDCPICGSGHFPQG